MKKQVNKYYILLLLALMFAAPGMTAYLFYQHPGWLGSATVNKGTLLSPPILLDFLPGQSKWRIIFWSPDLCDEACFEDLNTLARARLALGRKLYQVDQWLVLGDKAYALTEKNSAQLKLQDFHTVQLSSPQKAPLPSKAQVYVVNPDNYLILAYQTPVKPDDIYKDLKLLLRN